MSPKKLKQISSRTEPYTKDELRKLGYIPFEIVQKLLDIGTNPQVLFYNVWELKNGL